MRILFGYGAAFVLPALLGIGIVVIATMPYGVGLSPDSAGYIATARHLASGHGAISFDDAPLLAQPPLYPALLAVIDYGFGIHPVSSARFVNAVLLGLILYLSGLLVLQLRTFRSTPALALVVTVFFLLSGTLLHVSLMLWSEPLFICLMLLYLVYSRSYAAEGDAVSLVLLSLSVGLACLTRYIGVILILTGAVDILMLRRGRQRAIHVAVFTVISSVPLGIWVIRNYLASATLFGPRASSRFSLLENLGFASKTFVSWYVPAAMSAHTVALAILLTAGAGALGVSMVGDWRRWRAVITELRSFLLVSVAYVVFLLGSSTIILHDQIDDRLLAPIFVPASLIALSLVSETVLSFGKRWSAHFARLSLAGVMALGLVYPATVTVRLIAFTIHEGQGYNSKLWQDSEIRQYLRFHRARLESECVTIYANGAAASYLFTNLQARTSPRRRQRNGPASTNTVARAAVTWPETDKACLVWFDRIVGNNLITVDELQTQVSMTRMARLEDGEIYSVRRK